jgi:protein TonB
MTRVDGTHRDNARYRIRILSSVVLALAASIGCVRLWPTPSLEDVEPPVFHTTVSTVPLEMIQPTQQVRRPPPPPTPLPPVVVPNDVELEPEVIEFPDEILIEDVNPGVETGPATGPPPVVAQADVGPRPVRFVEPEYTREARRRKIRASVLVEVLVDERGRVAEGRIIDRFLHGGDDEPPEPVDFVGFGIEEAALSAAQRWQFRPARHGGEAVRSYYTLTFRFGV